MPPPRLQPARGRGRGAAAALPLWLLLCPHLAWGQIAGGRAANYRWSYWGGPLVPSGPGLPTQLNLTAQPVGGASPLFEAGVTVSSTLALTLHLHSTGSCAAINASAPSTTPNTGFVSGSAVSSVLVPFALLGGAFSGAAPGEYTLCVRLDGANPGASAGRIRVHGPADVRLLPNRWPWGNASVRSGESVPLLFSGLPLTTAAVDVSGHRTDCAAPGRVPFGRLGAVANTNTMYGWYNLCLTIDGGLLGTQVLLQLEQRIAAVPLAPFKPVGQVLTILARAAVEAPVEVSDFLRNPDDDPDCHFVAAAVGPAVSRNCSELPANTTVARISVDNGIVKVPPLEPGLEVPICFRLAVPASADPATGRACTALNGWEEGFVDIGARVRAVAVTVDGGVLPPPPDKSPQVIGLLERQHTVIRVRSAAVLTWAQLSIHSVAEGAEGTLCTDQDSSQFTVLARSAADEGTGAGVDFECDATCIIDDMRGAALCLTLDGGGEQGDYRVRIQHLGVRVVPFDPLLAVPENRIVSIGQDRADPVVLSFSGIDIDDLSDRDVGVQFPWAVSTDNLESDEVRVFVYVPHMPSYAMLLPEGDSDRASASLPLPRTLVGSANAADIIWEVQQPFGGRRNYTLTESLQVLGRLVPYIKPVRASGIACKVDASVCIRGGTRRDPATVGAFTRRDFSFVLEGGDAQHRFALARAQGGAADSSDCAAISNPIEANLRQLWGQETVVTFPGSALAESGEYMLCSTVLNNQWSSTDFKVVAVASPYQFGRPEAGPFDTPIVFASATAGTYMNISLVRGVPLNASVWLGPLRTSAQAAFADYNASRDWDVHISFNIRECNTLCGIGGCHSPWFRTQLRDLQRPPSSGNWPGRAALAVSPADTLKFPSDRPALYLCAAVVRKGRTPQEAEFLNDLSIRVQPTPLYVAGHAALPAVGLGKTLQQFANTKQYLPLSWDSEVRIDMHTRWLPLLRLRVSSSGLCEAGLGDIAMQRSASKKTFVELPELPAGEYRLCVTVLQSFQHSTFSIVPWSPTDLRLKVGPILGVGDVGSGRIGLPRRRLQQADGAQSVQLPIATSVQLAASGLAPRFADAQMGVVYLDVTAGSLPCVNVTWELATGTGGRGYGVVAAASTSGYEYEVTFPEDNLIEGRRYQLCVLLRPSGATLGDWYAQLALALPWAQAPGNIEVFPFSEIDGRRTNEAVVIFAGLSSQKVTVCEGLSCIFLGGEPQKLLMRIAEPGQCRWISSGSPWLPPASIAKFDPTRNGWYFEFPTYDVNNPANALAPKAGFYDLCIGDNRQGQMRNSTDFAVAFVKVRVLALKLNDYQLSQANGDQTMALATQAASPEASMQWPVQVKTSPENDPDPTFNFDRNPVWFNFRPLGYCGAEAVHIPSAVLVPSVSSESLRVEHCSGSLRLLNKKFAIEVISEALDVCIAYGTVSNGTTCSTGSCAAPAVRLFQYSGLRYQVVFPRSLEITQEPSSELYPFYGVGPPVLLHVVPAPAVIIRDRELRQLTHINKDYVVLIKTMACEMHGVEDCIRHCEGFTEDMLRINPDAVGNDSGCTRNCEAASIVRCSGNGSHSEWPWSDSPVTWVAESTASSSQIRNRDITKVVPAADFADSGGEIVFGPDRVTRTPVDVTDEQDPFIVIAARFRVWYKLRFQVVGESDLATVDTAPFRALGCYNWSEHYATPRFRSASTSASDTDQPFESGLTTLRSSYYAVPNSSLCETCPLGGLCDGSTEMRAGSREGIGYWRPDVNVTTFYHCSKAEGGARGCLANTATGSCKAAYRPHRFPWHDNPLCTVCADDHGKMNGVSECRGCTAPWLVWLSAALLVVVFLLLILGMVVSNLRTSRENTQDEFSLLIKMFVSHLQMLALLTSLFEKLGTIGRNFFAVSKTASGNAVGRMVALDCVMQVDYFDQFRFGMLLPVIFAAFAAVLFGPVLALAKLVSNCRKEQSARELEDRRAQNRNKGFFGTKQGSSGSLKRRSRKSKVAPAPEQRQGTDSDTASTGQVALEKDPRELTASSAAGLSRCGTDQQELTSPTGGAFTPSNLDIQKQRQSVIEADVATLFKEIDRRPDGSAGDGTLEKHELFNGLTRINREREARPELWKCLSHYGLHKIDNMDSLWHRLDCEEADGRVTMQEFCRALLELQQAVHRRSSELLRDAHQAALAEDSDSFEGDTASVISSDAGIDATLGFRVSSPGHMFRAYVASLFIFAFIVYPDILTMCANMLTCTEFDWVGGATRELLQVDMRINCQDDDYGAYKVAAIVLLCVYGFGTPLIFVVLHRLVQGKWVYLRDEISEAKKYKLKQARYMFGFLTAGYRRERWYWESLIMLRKLAAVVIAQAGIIKSPTLRNYLLMWAMLIFYILQTNYRPYAFSKLNELEERSIIVIILTVGMVLMYKEPTEPDNGGWVSEDRVEVFYPFTLFIVVMNIALLLVFLYYLFYYFRQTVSTVLLKTLVHAEKQYAEPAKKRPMWLIVWLSRQSRYPKCGGVVMYARDEHTGERQLDEKGKPLLQLLHKQKYLGDERGGTGRKGEAPPLRNILVTRRMKYAGEECPFDSLAVGEHLSFVPPAPPQREEQGVVFGRVSKLKGQAVTLHADTGENYEVPQSWWDDGARGQRRVEHSGSHVISVGTRVVRNPADWRVAWSKAIAPLSAFNGGVPGAVSVENHSVDCMLPGDCPALLVWHPPGGSALLFAEPPAEQPYRKAVEARTHQPVWQAPGGLRLFCAIDAAELDEMLVGRGTAKARWLVTAADISPSADLADAMDQCELGAWRSPLLSLTGKAMAEGCRFPSDSHFHGHWERKEADGWKAGQRKFVVDAGKTSNIDDSLGVSFHGTRIVAARPDGFVGRAAVQPAPGVVADPGRPQPFAELITEAGESGRWAVTALLGFQAVSSDTDVAHAFKAAPTHTAIRLRPPGTAAGDRRSVRIEVTRDAQQPVHAHFGELGFAASPDGLVVREVHGGAAERVGVHRDWIVTDVLTWINIGSSTDLAAAFESAPPAFRARVAEVGFRAPSDGVGTVVAVDLASRFVRVQWNKHRRRPETNRDYVVHKWVTARDEHAFLHRFGDHGVAVAGGKKLRPCMDVMPAPGVRHQPGSWKVIANTDVIPSKGAANVVAHVRWRSLVPPAGADGAAEGVAPHACHILSGDSLHDIGQLGDDHEESAARFRVVVKHVHRSNNPCGLENDPEMIDSARHPQSRVIYEESCRHSWGGRPCFKEPPEVGQEEFDKEDGQYGARLSVNGGEVFTLEDVPLGVAADLQVVDSHQGVKVLKGTTRIPPGLIIKSIGKGPREHPVTTASEYRRVLEENDSDSENEDDEELVELLSTTASAKPAPVVVDVSLTVERPIRRHVDGFNGGQYAASEELLNATLAPGVSSLAHVALEFQLWLPENEDRVAITPLRFKQEYSAAVKRWAKLHAAKDPASDLTKQYDTFYAQEPGFQALIVWHTPSSSGTGLLDQPQTALSRAVLLKHRPIAGDPLAALEQAQQDAEEEEEERKHVDATAGYEEADPRDEELQLVRGEAEANRRQADDILERLKMQFEYRPLPLVDEEGNRVPWRLHCTSVDEVMQEDQEVVGRLSQTLLLLMKQRQDFEASTSLAEQKEQEWLQREATWRHKAEGWNKERDELRKSISALGSPLSHDPRSGLSAASADAAAAAERERERLEAAQRKSDAAKAKALAEAAEIHRAEQEKLENEIQELKKEARLAWEAERRTRQGFAELQQSLQRAQQQQEEMEQRVAAAAQQREQLHEQIVASAEPGAKDAQELLVARAQLSDARAELEEARRLDAAARQELEQRREQQETTQGELEQALRERGELADELERRRRAEAALQDELGRGKEERAELESEVGRIQAEEAVAKDEAARQRREREELQQEMERARSEDRAQREELQQEVAALRKRLEEAEPAAAAEQQRQAEARAEAEELRRRLEESEEKAAAARKELQEKVTEQVAEQRSGAEADQLRELLAEVDKERAEAAAAMQQTRRLEEQVAAQRAEVEAKARELEERERESTRASPAPAQPLQRRSAADDSDDSDAEEVTISQRPFADGSRPDPVRTERPMPERTAAADIDYGSDRLATTLLRKLQEQDDQLSELLGQDWQKHVGKEAMSPPPNRPRQHEHGLARDKDMEKAEQLRRRAFKGGDGEAVYIPPPPESSRRPSPASPLSGTRSGRHSTSPNPGSRKKK
eukprot:TRINITY_DN10121_c0_g1_i1.p1 TRINITY_DN10121_c0_g1~~TRINITY_DN10121_c0_g1_i1.p1  ORF type:complete len:4193 (+),score=1392.82 TRINITY_DN10121_c0_g1_i1:92-12670(+)